MRPLRQAGLSRPHGAVSQELAARPKADEEALREAELALVAGGTDAPPTGTTTGNGRYGV